MSDEWDKLFAFREQIDQKNFSLIIEDFNKSHVTIDVMDMIY